MGLSGHFLFPRYGVTRAHEAIRFAYKFAFDFVSPFIGSFCI